MIEMMVAVTVSMFIIGALIAVVLGSASTSRSREGASDLQVNGRYALEQVKTDLFHAGFLGITGVFSPEQPISAGTGTEPAINVAGACDVTMIGMISERLRGSNDANPYTATCIPAANYLQGDVLTLRGLSPNQVVSPFSATRVYYHSAYGAGRPFVGPSLPAMPGNAMAPFYDFELREAVYYISPFTTSAAENPLVPALYRMRLSTGPAMVRELVASGVENMQIRYGVFRTDGSVRYVNADQVTLDADTNEWDLVESVQIWLLMRSVLPEPGYQNNNTYELGTQDIAVNDGYRRLILSSVIQLRN